MDEESRSSLERAIAIATALVYLGLVGVLLWQALATPAMRSQLNYSWQWLRWWYSEQRKLAVPAWVAEAMQGHTVESE